MTEKPKFLKVDPRTLRLPNSRQEGADPKKLKRQIDQYGDSTERMPTIIVNRDGNGVLQIFDGVTRATRLSKLLPGEKVTVDVLQDFPNLDFTRLPTVKDKL